MGKKKGKKKAAQRKTLEAGTVVREKPKTMRALEQMARKSERPNNPLADFARQLSEGRHAKPMTEEQRQAAGKRVSEVFKKLVAPPETVEKHLERLGMFYMVRPATNADRAGMPAGKNLKQVLVVDYDTLVKVEAAASEKRGALPEVYRNVHTDSDPGAVKDLSVTPVDLLDNDFSEPLLPLPDMQKLCQCGKTKAVHFPFVGGDLVKHSLDRPCQGIITDE